MKRFVITEEDRKHIMGLYEQLALLNIDPKNIYFGSIPLRSRRKRSCPSAKLGEKLPTPAFI